MAKKSHEDSGDFGFKPDKAAVEALAAASRQLPEYQKFKSNFDAFMSRYGLSNDGKLPTNVWNSVFLNLVKTDYKKSNQDIERGLTAGSSCSWMGHPARKSAKRRWSR